jgi:peptidoglycan hydrolase-like protein with peptidoglycan-binding domain
MVERHRWLHANTQGRAARPLLALATAVALAVGVTGCSGSPEETQLAAAQANVERAQKALSDAEEAATTADAALCAASADYITAIDRYGDVLTQTEPTVGDVRTAGADLQEPRDEVTVAAEGAQAAHDQVATAQDDLAEAQATLASLEGSTAAEETDEPEPTPTLPPASIDRVTQAEREFAEAQQGISDGTPLREASVEFNSAAVALEMAWLQLFAQSGCLDSDQQEQAQAAAAEYTAALQQALADAGYYDGEVDGVYGPETVAAIQALQKASGLPQTGAMDKATSAALQAELVAKGNVQTQEELAATAALQQTLALAGYWDGPIDGQWTDELTDALKEFQADLGVEPTGEVDTATITAFNKALEQATAPPTPTPSDPSPRPSASPDGPEASASPTS